MTSGCLCAKVVNNIQRNFNLCDFQTQGYARIHFYVQCCIRMEITVLYFKLCGRNSWSYSRKYPFSSICDRIRNRKVLSYGFRKMNPGLTTFLVYQSLFLVRQVILGRTFRVQIPIVIKFASSVLMQKKYNILSHTVKNIMTYRNKFQEIS